MIPVRVFKLEGGGYLTIPARTPHRIVSELEVQGAVVEELVARKMRLTSELAEAGHHVAREVEELAIRKAELVERQVQEERLDAAVLARRGFLEELEERAGKGKGKRKR